MQRRVFGHARYRCLLLALISLGCGGSSGKTRAGGAAGAAGSDAAGGSSGSAGSSGSGGSASGSGGLSGAGGATAGLGGSAGIGGFAGPNDGGADTSTDAPSGNDGPVCNSTSIGNAPLVQRTVVEGASPPTAPAGGTIFNGTYYVTSVTYYHSSTGCSVPDDAPKREADVVIVSSPSTGTVRSVSATAAGTESRFTATYTASGTSFVTTGECISSNGQIFAFDGGQPTATAGYTATQTQVTTFTVDPLDGVDAASGICGTTVTVSTKQ